MPLHADIITHTTYLSGTTYEDLTHARSFLDTGALYQTLSQVQCQEDNIQQLVERLEIWYSQKNKDRPLSIFLVGVSGVGKTLSAELLSYISHLFEEIVPN